MPSLATSLLLHHPLLGPIAPLPPSPAPIAVVVAVAVLSQMTTTRGSPLGPPVTGEMTDPGPVAAAPLVVTATRTPAAPAPTLHTPPEAIPETGLVTAPAATVVRGHPVAPPLVAAPCPEVVGRS